MYFYELRKTVKKENISVDNGHFLNSFIENISRTTLIIKGIKTLEA